MIDRLDTCFLPGNPMGRLLDDIEEPLKRCGYTKIDVMQRIIYALFPEEFMDDDEINRRISDSKNFGHNDEFCGILPHSKRRGNARLGAFLKALQKAKDRQVKDRFNMTDRELNDMNKAGNKEVKVKSSNARVDLDE